LSTSQQPTGPKADPPAESPPTRARPLPKTQPGEGGLFRLPDVVLFAAGVHTDQTGRTREYGDDYLKAVADNYQRFKDDPDLHIDPPAVLGHEDVQAELAKILADDAVYKQHFADRKPTSGGGPGRTDQPAAGWLRGVRFDAARRCLIGDIEGIPPSVAGRIDGGQIRYPSIELKENQLGRDGKPVGPLPWRLGLLGGTPPACKSVPPLGQAHFADLPEGVVVFADAVPADGTETTSKPSLKTLRLHHPTVSEKTMAMLTKPVIESLFEDANANAEGGAAGGDAHSQLVAAYVKAGLGSQADADKLTDDQLKQALSAAGVTAMADSNPTATTPDPKAKPPAVPPELAAFADGLRAEFAEKEKALDAKAKAIKDAADGALAAQKARDDAEWARAVDAFCDQEAGLNDPPGAPRPTRIAPWELDKDDPFNLRNRLKAIPAAETIAFADADGKPQTKSRREAELEAIRKRPVRMFGDRIGVTDAKSKDDPLAALEERSKKFAEDQNKRLAASYQRN
jgi:hypothetical protein